MGQTSGGVLDSRLGPVSDSFQLVSRCADEAPGCGYLPPVDISPCLNVKKLHNDLNLWFRLGLGLLLGIDVKTFLHFYSCHIFTFKTF